MPEKKNTLNAYVCNLLHGTVTIHREDGTTPMFISCPVCNEQATSRMGRVDPSLEPTHEWYRPTKEQCIADATKWVEENDVEEMKMINKEMVTKGFLDHLEMGGLFLRKINN